MNSGATAQQVTGRADCGGPTDSVPVSKRCEKKSRLLVCPLTFLDSCPSISLDPLEGSVCVLQVCEQLFA